MLLQAGARLHQMLPLQIQHLVEAKPVISGARAKFIAFVVKRLDTDDMWKATNAWKTKFQELPETHEFHGFWASPDRPAAVRQIGRLLNTFVRAIKEKWPALKDSIETCFQKKKIYCGDELVFSMTTSYSNQEPMYNATGCLLLGTTKEELDNMYQTAKEQLGRV